MSNYGSSNTSSLLPSTGDTAFTTPYSIPSSNNSKLISLLSKKPKSNNIDDKSSIGTKTEIDKNEEQKELYHLNLQLPTPKQFDASDIIEINNTKILTQQSNQQINNKSNESNSTKELVSEVINENDEPKYSIDISSINPTNLKDQISTILINNFPNLKNNVIENILLKLISSSNEKSRSFEWSTINSSEFTDQKLVFIRFSKLEDLKWFIENYENDIRHIIPKTELIFSPEVKQTLSTIKIIESTKLTQSYKDKIKNQIKLICYNNKNFATTSKSSGVEDLDTIMKSYSTYRVDNNDLIDVPKEMKDKIVKEIIKFRSKMLNIEKLNRQKQNEKERLKIKKKLNDLYRNLKETNEQTQEEEEVVDEYEDVVIPQNQYEELNDEEYAEIINSKQQIASDQEYQKELQNFKQKEEAEKLKLITKLINLENYENSIIDHKLESIEILKKLDKTNNLYQKNYNEYLKQRQVRKFMEEQKDEEDRKLEEEENKNAKPQQSKVEVSEIVEVVEEPPYKKTKTDQQPSNKTTTTIIIKDLASDIQQKIQQKIIESIEEYLGIQDEILIQVINDNLNTYNLTKKQELINELVEVLDEDAEVLVNDLFKYIQSIS
ncbi:SNU71 [Candida jiufengensis]|uniref:SNU71 n=1 Tax=Candida jiufengensis TaxID=497108 RepID=UPI002223FC52|nr:SNU71 [Candida jiufengensis]KAI5951456.1 SNU71 [Candida jiufengensis]